MERLEAVVRGEVQRVGYRDLVQRIARRLNITGYVQNLKPYDVLIVAEGRRDKLEEFLKQIEIRKFPVFVEEIQVKWSKAKGEFEFFEIRRGPWEEELGERLDFAATLLFTMIEKQDKHIQLTEEILRKQDEHINLTREILRKQDEHIDLTKEILHETRQISAKQDEHIAIARSTHKKLDSFSKTEEEIKKLRQEFQQLKEAIRKAGIEV